MFVVTGCGVSVKQSGNKIYTDIDAETAYAYTRAALVAKDFEIEQMDQDTFTITAKGEMEEYEGLDVVAKVNTIEGGSEVVISVMKEDVEDQEKSEELAARAVEEIIKELDKYGKFQAREEKIVNYPFATMEDVNDYVVKVLNAMDKEVAITGTKSNLIEAQAVRATHPFNEAMQVAIGLSANDDRSIDVQVVSEIEGNYDIAGNKAFMQFWLDRFSSLLGLYPMAAQNFKYRYYLLSAEKAESFALDALKKLDYMNESYQGNIVAFQNNIKVVVDSAEFVDSAVLNVDGFADGGADGSKAELEKKLVEKMNKYREELALYQAYISAEKLYTSVNASDMMTISEKILKKLGYSKIETEGGTVIGQKGNYTAAVRINDLGREGLSVEIISVYNGRAANNAQLAKSENSKLVREFGRYDRMDLK